MLSRLGASTGVSCAGAADECLPEANTLVTGACLDFVAAFQADTEALSKLSERDFRQAVAIGPTPSDQCCIDAAAYVRGVSHHFLAVSTRYHGNTEILRPCFVPPVTHIHHERSPC